MYSVQRKDTIDTKTFQRTNRVVEGWQWRGTLYEVVVKPRYRRTHAKRRKGWVNSSPTTRNLTLLLCNTSANGLSPDVPLQKRCVSVMSKRHNSKPRPFYPCANKTPLRVEIGSVCHSLSQVPICPRERTTTIGGTTCQDVRRTSKKRDVEDIPASSPHWTRGRDTSGSTPDSDSYFVQKRRRGLMNVCTYGTCVMKFGKTSELIFVNRTLYRFEILRFPSTSFYLFDSCTIHDIE